MSDLALTLYASAISQSRVTADLVAIIKALVITDGLFAFRVPRVSWRERFTSGAGRI